MTMSNMTDFMDRTLDTCDACDTVDHVSCVCEYSVPPATATYGGSSARTTGKSETLLESPARVGDRQHTNSNKRMQPPTALLLITSVGDDSNARVKRARSEEARQHVEGCWRCVVAKLQKGHRRQAEQPVQVHAHDAAHPDGVEARADDEAVQDRRSSAVALTVRQARRAQKNPQKSARASNQVRLQWLTWHQQATTTSTTTTNKQTSKQTNNKKIATTNQTTDQTTK